MLTIEQKIAKLGDHAIRRRGEPRRGWLVRLDRRWTAHLRVNNIKEGEENQDSDYEGQDFSSTSRRKLRNTREFQSKRNEAPTKPYSHKNQGTTDSSRKRSSAKSSPSETPPLDSSSSSRKRQRPEDFDTDEPLLKKRPGHSAQASQGFLRRHSTSSSSNAGQLEPASSSDSELYPTSVIVRPLDPGLYYIMDEAARKAYIARWYAKRYRRVNNGGLPSALIGNTEEPCTWALRLGRHEILALLKASEFAELGYNQDLMQPQEQEPAPVKAITVTPSGIKTVSGSKSPSTKGKRTAKAKLSSPNLGRHTHSTTPELTSSKKRKFDAVEVHAEQAPKNDLLEQHVVKKQLVEERKTRSAVVKTPNGDKFGSKPRPLTNPDFACYQNVYIHGMHALSKFRAQFPTSASEAAVIAEYVKDDFSTVDPQDIEFLSRRSNKTRENQRRHHQIQQRLEPQFRAREEGEELRLFNHVSDVFNLLDGDVDSPVNASPLQMVSGRLLDAALLGKDERYDGCSMQDPVEFGDKFVGRLHDEGQCFGNYPWIKVISKRKCSKCGNERMLPCAEDSALRLYVGESEHRQNLGEIFQGAFNDQSKFKQLRCESSGCSADKGDFRSEEGWSHARINGRPDYFLADVSLGLTGSKLSGVIADSEMITLPTSNVCEGEETKNKYEPSETQYQLRAMARFIRGSKNGGHYTCFKKVRQQWYEITDFPKPESTLKTWDEVKAASCLGRLFFYERLD